MDTLLAESVLDTMPAPYPEALVLDWTDYCNAKCFFCYREKYEAQIGGRGEFIPFAKLRKLEKVLSSVKFFGITSGIGEPLLHPELKPILDWLYDINPGLLIRTTTNGTALTGDKAPWFANHLDWLSVSLNASNAEAHFRDMFPHLVKRGIDAEKRWQLHLRHLSEFIGGLPPADRPRIRMQMVAHRYNIQDIVEFVRLTKRLGGSHAVITNIAVHMDTVDWSLYWVRDQYNDAVEEACDVGARLGVKVDAARFFTSIKPVLDLDVVCRDPIDIAYISRASVGAPCCQWAEEGIPTDVYSDDGGFERYWNHNTLQRLRKKRNLQSCQVCGMSRVFDEMSFHFSPKLKQDLISEGRLSEVDRESDFPDAELVRGCVESGVDLPSLRRSLLKLDLPADEWMARLAREQLAALPELDEACWEAFKKADVPAGPVDLSLAGPFIGIGWGASLHEAQNKIVARWLSRAQMGSIFVRLPPGSDDQIHLTIHHIHPEELANRLRLTVCGQPIATRLLVDENGRTVFSGTLPDDLIRAHDGRLWVQITCEHGDAEPLSGNISFMRLEISETKAIELAHASRSALARAVLRNWANAEAA